MGRAENPIAPCDKALQALVQWLRDQRTRAGLSYAQLAERTQHLALPGGGQARCSADTLARAASGLVVPRHRAVLAYALACEADPAEAERLWKRARYQQSMADRRNEEPAPHVRYVRNFAELRAALVELYRKDGSRPYEELEKASGGVLAHSTVARVISGISGQPTREFVLAFAQVCGVRGAVALNDWRDAWDRAEERRSSGIPRSLIRRRSSVRTEQAKGGRVEVYLDRVRLNDDGQETWQLRQDLIARADRPGGLPLQVKHRPRQLKSIPRPRTRHTATRS
ncbi:helix-turn-helix domain-containing protein [Streptomyces sp. VNUA116]|uniref:helix-turn-helix domain-containing protein n=1 Tax=Streptomyces sp. VNUA116 TaxID=3062449 RepID=UPI00267663D8|nr:helix-turn-helix domain-containing protein [Streptomyces sp. VNUA116]WKU42623.1 helix-turn-helix domain-containing protein [Streptomyces sp. VNUA116]